ncbi:MULTISPECIES: lipocalin family protein [unclassified Vibrio]|uniref:lipocalin family protein n=1 Tax=unclassified Vibrio TaxID=2614977 RepID=UPI00159E9BB7|nr:MULTISPECIES: lipocalin family protein [unclassified Vibrio]NVN84000.1 hypothetical protein [Vibrio sp. Scap16]QLE93865.1 hypothetical protein FLM53_13000 [Vibrio sp. Scap24]
MTYKILAMLMIKLLFTFRGSKPTSKIPASDFDAERFAGTWYSACYIPHPLQSKLGSLSFSFLFESDGNLKLTTRGYNAKKKEWKTKEQAATFKGSQTEAWFSVEANSPYEQQRKVIFLNEDYTQALLVGPTKNTLQILYRTAEFTKQDLDSLIERAQSMGFKTSKLVRVSQHINDVPEH